MSKGVHLDQCIFRDDDKDVTKDEAREVLVAFLDMVGKRDMHSGGTARLIDENGGVIGHVCSHTPAQRRVTSGLGPPPVPPEPPSPYEDLEIGELSGDEARRILQRISNAAGAFRVAWDKGEDSDKYAERIAELEAETARLKEEL